jgi:hypothetical protein
MRIIAILLIIAGCFALAYQGFTYISRERVAEVGPVAVNADVERTVWIPPVVGGAAVIAGAVMLGLASKKD